MGPMSLLMVGATLASARIGHELKGALGLALLKNLLLPALVALVGMAMGLHGLPLTVMVVTASLPIGANVFMFSQRYNVAEELGYRRCCGVCRAGHAQRIAGHGLGAVFVITPAAWFPGTERWRKTRNRHWLYA